MNLSKKEEFKLAAKTIAEWHEGNYPGAEVDAEVTGTGYAELSSEVQAAGSWEEFHAEVEKVVSKLQAE